MNAGTMKAERVVITTAPVLSGVSQNGLATVIENTAARSREGVVIISGDSSPGELHGIEVIPAGSTQDAPGIRQRWHNLGYWQILHESAFTRPVLSEEGIQALWGTNKHPSGNPEDLRQFIDDHTPSLETECQALERFRHPIDERVPDGATISLQDFSCGQILRVFRDDFKRKDCTLELHHHAAIHPNLSASRIGRELVEAYSFADSVYVHTEEYRQNLIAQLPAGAKTEVRTFELGVNFRKLRHGAELIHAANFRSTIPEFEKLSADQQSIATEMFETEHTHRHRFICIDRIDAIKGNLTVYDAVRRHLSNELTRGVSLDELRESQRFFFLYTARASLLQGEHPLWTRYARFAESALASLAGDFPGIVFTAKGFEGVHSVAIGALVRNQTLITGASQDGLNLSCMESAVVNRGRPVSIIVGDGAGFSRDVIFKGGRDLGYFPRAGDVEAFARSISEVCGFQRSNPEALSERTTALVDRFIVPRGEAAI